MNKQHNNTTLLKNFIKQIGMKQLIKEPTHFNRLSPDSLLDIIITNSTSITNSGTKNVNISNHEMIFCTRKHIPKVKQQATFTGRSYREYNQDVFQNSLRNENWDDFWRQRDPDIAWEMLRSKIAKILDDMCPIRTFKIANCKEPWLNNDLHEKLRDKDYFLKRAKHTNCPDDWNIAKYLRNQTKILIKKAKSDYFKDKLYSNRNNSNKFRNSGN